MTDSSRTKRGPTTRTGLVNRVTPRGHRTVQYRVRDNQATTAWYAPAVGHEPHFHKPLCVGLKEGATNSGSSQTARPQWLNRSRR